MYSTTLHELAKAAIAAAGAMGAIYIIHASITEYPIAAGHRETHGAAHRG